MIFIISLNNIIIIILNKIETEKIPIEIKIRTQCMLIDCDSAIYTWQ